MKSRLRSAFLALCLSVPFALSAQTSTEPVPVPYGPSEFPEWQEDLRRAEILSFGALPFVTFVSSIYYDVYRYYTNDQKEGYLPWPLKKSESAIGLTQNEQKNILGYSVGIAIGVAVFDYGYRTVSRLIRNSKAERRNQEYVDPIQIEPMQEPSPTIEETR